MTAPVAAAVARSGATKAAAGRAGSGGAARKAAPLPRAGTRARAQRDAIDKIKADRPAPEVVDDSPPAPSPVNAAAGVDRSRRNSRSAPAVMTDQRGAPSWWYREGDGIRAANTGGGVVLGVLAHILVVTYLRGGRDGVKKLLKAKFFNEVPA